MAANALRLDLDEDPLASTGTTDIEFGGFGSQGLIGRDDDFDHEDDDESQPFSRSEFENREISDSEMKRILKENFIPKEELHEQVPDSLGRKLSKRFPLHYLKMVAALAILCVFVLFFIWTLGELILKKIFQ